MQTTPPYYRYSWLIATLGLVALLVGLVVMVLRPGMRYAAWVILALGVLLLATAFVIDFRRVRGAITGKRGIFSTGTTVMALVFVGITLLINSISIGNYHRFDVTGLAQFTLTSQTKDVLSKVEIPVTAICFFIPDDPYGGLSSYVTYLLEEYQNYTDQLTIKVIDPDEQPDQARLYGITDYDLYQSVVFETEQGRRMVSPADIIVISEDDYAIEAENALTSAILEVTGVVQKKVYFLTGHGESSIIEDYSYARQGLLDNLYKVYILDLLYTLSIPEDCAGLIIAGPQKPLDSREVEIIRNYLKDGGWVMVLLNPNPPQEIRELLSDWWVKIEDGTVVDASSYLSPNMASPIVPRTRNEFGLSETYFPEATAIIPQEDYPDTIILYPLFYTSGNSWLEKDFDPTEEPEFNEGIEQMGPYALGILIGPASTEETEEINLTRLIVVGDSDFASNQHFYNGDNGNLFLNLVELLTAGKELISIERKVLPFRRMLVGSEETSFIQISSIGLLPLLVLIAGGIIWWRRR